MRRLFVSLMALVVVALGVSAQQTIFGGAVVTPANMTHMDAAKYAQTEHSYMSSRVAAMGGAFTSLGADLSSMSINPAGLGMYRTSTLGFSVNYNGTRSTNATQISAGKKGDFAFNQIGTAINLYQGSGTLVSFTMGFGYNKIADLNFTDRASWSDGQVTLGEFFAEQMYGFPPTILQGSADPFRNTNIYPDEWGGVVAYQTYFIDPVMDSDGLHAGGYTVTGVPLSSRIHTNLEVGSSGSVGEYDFSMGFNIGNILYLGTTIGIVDIQQSIYHLLAEQYEGGGNGDEILRTMAYCPTVDSYGSGVNFKIGAILRPISAIRLGVAYHTATSVDLTRNYRTEMTTLFANNDSYTSQSLINSYAYSYSAPAKLMLGASVTIGSRAIISVDYDKVWYGGMDMHTDGLEEAFAADVKNDLGSANNFRAGLEIVPVSGIYLRAGYAYYGSPLGAAAKKYNNEGNPFYGTYKTSTNNFSLGAGVRFGLGSSLDLVWTLSRAHYTSALMYYYSYVDENNNIEVSGPTLSGLVHNTNSIGLTYTVAF